VIIPHPAVHHYINGVGR